MKTCKNCLRTRLTYWSPECRSCSTTSDEYSNWLQAWTSITDCDFSVRCCVFLKSQGIHHLEQLTSFSRSYVLGMKNIGKKNFAEIEEIMAENGLTWKEED